MNPTVMVVDDVADAREVLSYALELEGYRVVQAASGIEALEHAAAHRPAIIIMDLQMLHMDGIEASRRLKSDPWLRHIPLIANTAFPTEIHSEDLFAAVLPKPCPFDRVLRTVAECQSPATPAYLTRHHSGNSAHGA